MNDFTEDDVWQRQQRDALLEPFFYKKLPAAYTFADGDMELQERHIDTVLCYYTGRLRTIEEKIVRWKGKVYKAFFFETHSCTLPGMETLGWMFNGQADVLLYCFQREDGGLDCYWIDDFQAVQRWFWSRKENFPEHTMPTRNRTRGRLVPIADVINAGFVLKRFQIEPVHEVVA